MQIRQWSAGVEASSNWHVVNKISETRATWKAHKEILGEDATLQVELVVTTKTTAGTVFSPVDARIGDVTLVRTVSIEIANSRLT